MTETEEQTESLEDLAAAATGGCLISFEKIVDQNKDRLFTFLFQITGNAQDAEDITQETFIKAYKHLASFDRRARFSTWLFAIAKNTAFTHLRKRRTHESIDELAEMLPAPAATVDGDQVASLWALARSLKPKLFETLWLFYAEGFSLKEVAEIMQTNAITVRVNLHRARAALAKKCKFYL